MRPLLANAPPGLAEEMLPSLGSRSPFDDELSGLLAEPGVTLPASLLAYLSGPAAECDLEWAEINVPGNTNLSRWRTLFAQRELVDVGLLQVATGPCGDPVCLDLHRRREDGECPVVVINHDRVGSEQWTSAREVRKHVSAEFASFSELLRAVCEGLPVEYRRQFREG